MARAMVPGVRRFARATEFTNLVGKGAQFQPPAGRSFGARAMPTRVRRQDKPRGHAADGCICLVGNRGTRLCPPYNLHTLDNAHVLYMSNVLGANSSSMR